MNWQVRGIPGKEPVQGLFSFFLVPEMSVKSPSSIGNYESGLDSYMLCIFYIARERERNFLFVRYSLVSTPEGFAGDPVVAGRSWFAPVVEC